MADGKSLKEQNSGLIARHDDRTYRRLRVDRCRTAAPSFDERAARSRRVSRRQQHRDYGLSDDTLAMPRLMGLGKRALIHRGANRHMTEGKNILGGAAPSWLDYTPLLPTAYSDSYEEA